MPSDIIVSWSELQTGRACPHKHQLAYKERWTRRPGDNSPLGKGTMWHLVMENWYRSLKEKPGDRPAAIRAVDELFWQFEDDDRDPDVIDLVRWMFRGYLDVYGTDDEWEILGVEYRFQVPIRVNGKRTGFTVKGGVDVVAKNRITGRNFIWDHKSRANVPTDDDLSFEDQLGLYKWALLTLGKRVFGLMHNIARTTRNKGDHEDVVKQWHLDKAAGLKPGAQPKPQPLEGRFKRIYTNRTDREMETLAMEALATARALYSKHNAHERHPDSEHCKRMCDFREACLAGRKEGDDFERQYLVSAGFIQDFRRH